MQQDRNKEQDPTQQNNPETLAVSDEKQRKTDNNQESQELPTGNERDEKTDTAGSKAGIGE